MKLTQFYEIDITPIVKQKTVSERLGVKRFLLLSEAVFSHEENKAQEEG